MRKFAVYFSVDGKYRACSRWLYDTIREARDAVADIVSQGHSLPIIIITSV